MMFYLFKLRAEGTNATISAQTRSEDNLLVLSVSTPAGHYWSTAMANSQLAWQRRWQIVTLETILDKYRSYGPPPSPGAGRA